ncbi:hypothetical protein GQX74_005723 [Glossina fuscipes]|nr:hypothetical protein GQX74_005723 [Glossina fuscipes]
MKFLLKTNRKKSKVNRDEGGKVNNPESSLVSAGFQTANGKKISISEKSQISVQNILREFQDNLQETNYETELKDLKARMSFKIETIAPCPNRKLPVQEKGNDAVLMANRPKRWRPSGLSRTRTNYILSPFLCFFLIGFDTHMLQGSSTPCKFK